jgi:hypothetical protein
MRRRRAASIASWRSRSRSSDVERTLRVLFDANGQRRAA